MRACKGGAPPAPRPYPVSEKPESQLSQQLFFHLHLTKPRQERVEMQQQPLPRVTAPRVHSAPMSVKPAQRVRGRERA